MIQAICDFCGQKMFKEFVHKVKIEPWAVARTPGHVYQREFDCCEECAKAIEHRLIMIESNYLWRGKDPNRRYKNWSLKQVADKNIGRMIPESEYQAVKKQLYDLLNRTCIKVRARHESDDVCGLCQYDGAYIGESGDWCNECPGFEKSDCFTMSNEIRKLCGVDLVPDRGDEE